MTPSELKYNVEANNTDSHFFDRETMKFFGDSMKNFGVRSTTIQSYFDEQGQYNENGFTREVWELYRKRLVKGNNQGSFYFDKMTFKRVYAMP